MLDHCLADSRIHYSWYTVESIHTLMIQLHVLQCWFVSGSNKNQRRDRIISNFTKGKTFLYLMTTKCSRVILQCGFPSCTLQFGQEKNIRGHSIESRAYWSTLKIARMFLILTSRNRMMNIFVIATLIPYEHLSYSHM